MSQAYPLFKIFKHLTISCTSNQELKEYTYWSFELISDQHDIKYYRVIPKNITEEDISELTFPNKTLVENEQIYLFTKEILAELCDMYVTYNQFMENFMLCENNYPDGDYQLTSLNFNMSSTYSFNDNVNLNISDKIENGEVVGFIGTVIHSISDCDCQDIPVSFSFLYDVQLKDFIIQKSNGEECVFQKYTHNYK